MTDQEKIDFEKHKEECNKIHIECFNQMRHLRREPDLKIYGYNNLGDALINHNS